MNLCSAFFRKSTKRLTANCWSTVFMLEVKRHYRQELTLCSGVHSRWFYLVLLSHFIKPFLSSPGLHHPLCQRFPAGTRQWHQDSFRGACWHVQTGPEHLPQLSYARNYGTENMVKEKNTQNTPLFSIFYYCHRCMFFLNIFENVWLCVTISQKQLLIYCQVIHHVVL